MSVELTQNLTMIRFQSGDLLTQSAGLGFDLVAILPQPVHFIGHAPDAILLLLDQVAQLLLLAD